jgi:transposase
MRYCLSFDIAKGKSVAGLFDENREVLIKPHEINHTKQDFDYLMQSITDDVKSRMGVIMESTSIYHEPVFHYVAENGIVPVVLNALIAKMQKQTLRKTKTDKIDCAHLATIYFENKQNVQTNHARIYREMQELSRHVAGLTKTLVIHKNRFRQLIGKTFPTLEEIWETKFFFGETALRFMIRYPHADLVSETRIDALGNALSSVSGRHKNQYLKMAQKVKQAAKESLTAVDKTSVVCEEVSELAEIILVLENQIETRKRQLIAMAEQTRYYNNINSIFGIGDWTAASLIAELKDVTRYSNIKKLTAGCGLDPTIVKSGKTINYHGAISKRGNRRARWALHSAVSTIVTVASKNQKDNPILLYYKKKRSEGKHHYAALTASATKLLRIIYTICVNDSTYRHSL